MSHRVQVKENAQKGRRTHRQRKKEESPRDDGFSVDKLSIDQMLFVPCLLDGSKEVDLLVDTGAAASAIPWGMVKALGLQEKLNRSKIQGNAAGVGSSNILGIVENVDCQIGPVKFTLFFMVLEGAPYCILGLDQLRRFKWYVHSDHFFLID